MNAPHELEAALEHILGSEGSHSHKKSAASQLSLRLRNVFVVLAVSLFLLSLCLRSYPSLRALGYLFGALAYICEILVLTDCFKVRIPHNELFMPYCFGPLYLIMGFGYLFG